jgi:hypothetical protein
MGLEQQTTISPMIAVHLFYEREVYHGSIPEEEFSHSR